MRHIAIIGSGPAGYYTAEAAQKKWGEEVRVDIFDLLPVPFGLIRSGVAPDHQSIKGVSRRYEKTALGDNVRFAGNVHVGQDVTVAELQELYDAVILATGAPQDRQLDIEGGELDNVFGSASFVGWYNGHPQFAGLSPDLSCRKAVIVGMGNVALDVARILSKTRVEFANSDIVRHALDALDHSAIRTITILGRRGPHQIMMTPKELGELVHLNRATPCVDPVDLPPVSDDATLEPGVRKSVALLRDFAAISESVRDEKSIRIEFGFFVSPLRFMGKNGRVTGIEVERTTIESGRATGTGETSIVPADLVVTCIGYRTSPINGVPFDERAGRFANNDGRIMPGLYCVGWARRGPSGTIGTNRPDGFGIIDLVEEDIGAGRDKRGREGFEELAARRGLDIVTFRDWQKIEAAEIAAARDGSPREKFVDIDSLIAARDG
ncbi:FAD-dependent oxidoreductase [Qipengyuania spongiae]|uniref:FAD-dependent oxidoreductase n=1 Tax=Qipengyuania spongiae TaxID=2909673 RepID=A0ABY5SVV9_9SPHN|nr:FAD-dependent oxidoreductase [Qipengyuania spongiae]UVI38700.1 FAD-dependent oxidoreductase [Qipengyuania spongiae]